MSRVQAISAGVCSLAAVFGERLSASCGGASKLLCWLSAGCVSSRSSGRAREKQARPSARRRARSGLTGNNLDKARRIFERTTKHQPRIRLTIGQLMRVLDQWPQK